MDSLQIQPMVFPAGKLHLTEAATDHTFAYLAIVDFAFTGFKGATQLAASN
ncbi:hypothetical protein BS47DRAFT_1392894 [Hydnum rufescens UP504]|uniref:Uncharacterized protein n=1 Tax=Hydnum rufescens UP504 TaxID=1448309 RepID=A0A9P6AZ29_9AGAM|nr:hypothetical protein BS47DRAFT_1392894 [Hydnum rufescens UP504]